MTSVFFFRIIDQEQMLRPGDLAVYGHPSDNVSRLCLPVTTVTEYGDGSVFVEMQRGDGGIYKTNSLADRFVRGYRFLDGNRCPRTATAEDYIFVADRELRR